MGIFSKQQGVGGSIQTNEIDDLAITVAKLAAGSNGDIFEYVGGAWVHRGSKFALGFACGDETTVLTTGTDIIKFRMPYAFTITEVRATLSIAGTGAALVTADINESGSTILSTKV